MKLAFAFLTMTTALGAVSAAQAAGYALPRTPVAMLEARPAPDTVVTLIDSDEGGDEADSGDDDRDDGDNDAGNDRGDDSRDDGGDDAGNDSGDDARNDIGDDAGTDSGHGARNNSGDSARNDSGDDDRNDARSGGADDDADENDDCDDKDAPCVKDGTGNASKSGTVAPPKNGLFTSGTAPVVKSN